MELLREHDRIVREELEASRGQEVKHTGDGIWPHSLLFPAAFGGQVMSSADSNSGTRRANACYESGSA